MWYQVQDKLAIDQMWVNFLPSWWHRNYGVTLGERYMFEPDYRVEVHRFAERTVTERFPWLSIGSPDPKPRVVQPEWGNATIPALAGCEVAYPLDNHPCNLHLPAERLESLKAPADIGACFPYSEIIAQVRYLNGKLGLDQRPWLTTRGILNDAMLIQGTSIFMELTGARNGGGRLFDYTFDVLMALIAANYQDHAYRGHVWIPSCTNMMVSPACYEERLLAYDRAVEEKTRGYGQPFGIHHCGVLDLYAASYRKIRHIDWMEIGWDSDLRLALETFPETTFQYIFSPTFLMSADRLAVRERVEELLESGRGHWHRLRLSVPDIEYGTAEENLHEIIECCRRPGRPTL